MDETLSGNPEPDLLHHCRAQFLSYIYFPEKGKKETHVLLSIKSDKSLYLTDLKEMSCVSGTYSMATGRHPRLLMLGRS